MVMVGVVQQGTLCFDAVPVVKQLYVQLGRILGGMAAQETPIPFPMVIRR